MTDCCEVERSVLTAINEDVMLLCYEIVIKCRERVCGRTVHVYILRTRIK